MYPLLSKLAIILAVALMGAGAVPRQLAGAPEQLPPLEQALPPPSGDDPEDERAVTELLVRRPRGKEEALALLRAWVAAAALTQTQERQFQILLQALREDEQVETLVAEVVGSPRASRPGRLLLLRVVARSWVEPPPSWRRAIGKAIEQDDLAVSREAVATVKSRDLTDSDAILRTLSRQASAPTEMRVAALDAIAPRQRLSADAFALLTKQLATTDPLLRRTAARALGATRLDNKQLLHLAAEIPNLTPTAGALLLPTFARTRDSEVGLALMRGLRQAPTAQLLSVGDLDRLLSSYPTAVVEAALPLRNDLVTRSQQQRKHLAKVVTELPPGDAQRGKKIFFSAKASCATCHRAEGKGGTLGPNLSRIGVIRGRPELQESIVLPSAYVAPEFRSWVVMTTDGGVSAGMIVQETSDALYVRGREATASRIPRDRIEDIALSSTSLMPEGFDRLLSRQELSDLDEYLTQLR